MNAAAQPICVLVDGQCPICALYARHLRATFPDESVKPIDARFDSPEKRRALGAGLDPDQGMVAITPDGMLAGREAMVHLSRNLAPGASWLLRFCARVFRYRIPALVAYPMFKAARRCALWIKGIGPLA